MTREQQQFLELLRAGLWGRKADAALFEGGCNWKSVLRTAVEQTVQIVVADGLETLPEQLWPPKEAMLKLTMTRVRTGQMHQLLNTTLAQATNLLHAEGIPSVLLKGQGVAQNYIRPESRMCGDIDLYVGKDNFLKSYDILKELEGAECSKDAHLLPEEDLHATIKIGQAYIELHKRADNLTGRKDKSLQQWTKEKLDGHMTDSTLPNWNNNGTAVQTPDPTFDAFFILHHAIRHMISEGIGFRHICDWAMFLHKHHNEVDVAELAAKLSEYSMKTPWKEFSIIAHKHLGLPKEFIPLYPQDDRSGKTDKILSLIFSSGNFGKYDKDRRRATEPNYIKRKWHSLRSQTLRLFRHFNLFPSLTLSYGFHWLIGALRRLLKGE